MGTRAESQGAGGNIFALEQSLLGLLALIVGFTFLMALTRFEARREAVLMPPDTDETDLTKLLAALKSERAAHKATADKLKATEEAVAAANAKAQEAAALANPNAAGLAALVQDSAKALTAKATGELQARVAELETGLATATKSNEELLGKFQSRQIADEVRAAADELHVRPDAIADLLVFAAADLKVVDGEARTADGASVAEWLDAKKSTSGYLWPVSRGAGARGSTDNVPRYDGNDNPFKPGDGWSLTRQGQILTSDPERAKALQQLT